ncbi:FecR family protein [Chitinophaga vietnamensis]|uniref:FecR family protein n=1 Tax=Chitinophaga vietnamensis TaxID=2593957 RepID=UPI0011775CD6|nr:FecR family protein [Chitinophaga vietnamensis]
MEQERIWLLIGRKVSGEATLEELRELEELLKNDPSLRYKFSVLSNWQPPARDAIWDEKTESALARHLQRLEDAPETGEELPEFRESTRTRRLVMALSCLVLLLGGYCVFLLTKKKEPAPLPAEIAEIQTRDGSRSKAVLPDGSEVWLNGGSRITYNPAMNNGNTREIFLSGEAFFNVAKNADRPFIIHTARMDVKVLGTEFNVKAYPNDKTAETSLISGAVEVWINNGQTRKVLLEPSQKIVLNIAPEMPATAPKNNDQNTHASAAFKIENVKVNPQDSVVKETAWCDNLLVFDNESFEEIATSMERWYGIQIHLANNKLKTYHFTGTFKNETFTEVLEALKVTSPFHYRIVGNEVFINQ